MLGIRTRLPGDSKRKTRITFDWKRRSFRSIISELFPMSGSFSRFERVSLRVKVRNIYAGSLSMGGAQAGGDHSGSASRGRGRSEERHCRAARVIGRPNYFARIAWFFAPAAVNREKTRALVPSMTRLDSTRSFDRSHSTSARRFHRFRSISLDFRFFSFRDPPERMKL